MHTPCHAHTPHSMHPSMPAGYDMEDAMILNKSSMERGLGHGTLLKVDAVDLREDKGRRAVFAAEPHDAKSKVRVVR